jgi:hypothetical protein
MSALRTFLSMITGLVSTLALVAAILSSILYFTLHYELPAYMVLQIITKKYFQNNSNEI